MRLAAPTPLALPCAPDAEERTQRFDRDPGWEGVNNRLAGPITLKQDFGYSKDRRQVGGLIADAAEPAYYAKKLRPRTFDDPLTASGTLVCSGQRSHVLL